MPDVYVSKVLESVIDLLKEKKYYLAGIKFYKLVKYGTVIENKLLVLISSEISDVLRNGFFRVKEFKKEINMEIVGKILSSILELIKVLEEEKEVLSDQDKLNIFDLLIFITYNAEKIQAETEEFEEGRLLKKRGFRSELIL